MIEKMKKIYIYSPKEDASKMVVDLMKLGCVQVANLNKGNEIDNIENVTSFVQNEVFKERKLLSRLQIAINSIVPFETNKGIFSERDRESFDLITSDQVILSAFEVVEEIEVITREIKRISDRKEVLKFREKSLEPWKTLDIPVEKRNTTNCKVEYYTIPVITTPTYISGEMKKKEHNVYMEEIHYDEEYNYIGLISHKKDFKVVDRFMKDIGGRTAEFDEMSGTVANILVEVEKELLGLKRIHKFCESRLIEYGKNSIILKKAYDALKIRIDCEISKTDMLSTENVVIIAGWIPDRICKNVESLMELTGCYYEYKEKKENEESPVLLRSNRFVKPFEAINEMYSLPSSNSFDSNPVMAIFFFLFFGMMLSDAGYGIILTVGGFLGAKYLDLKPGAKRMLKLIGMVGISTTIWGALYGSWFGDAVPVALHTFLGIDIKIPQLLDPLKDPITILVISCLFGAIHIFTGMGVKAYMMIKRGDVLGAVFDVGFWYLLLSGLPILFLGGNFSEVGKWLAVTGAIGLVLTQGRSKPTIAGKAISGIMSLYDITAYFSDVLSYSRILALGLATGVIASVVNTMGVISGGGIMGFIIFLLIFLAGHTLNLAINALGAYVHASRLQYVEFYGKYYESGGSKFSPLSPKTKYIVVNETEETI